MCVKVVWFSIIKLSDSNPRASGTWISSMYQHLSKVKDVDIIANFYFAPVDKIEIQENAIKEIAVPQDILRKNKESQLTHLIDIIISLNPNLLHVWGTENKWGELLLHNGLSGISKLLEIQGLKFFLQKKEIFYGGLQETLIKKIIGVKELIYPKSKLYSLRSTYEEDGKSEIEVIRQYKYINTQSEWVRTLLKILFPDKSYFKTGIILRDSFLMSPEWFKLHDSKGSGVILTTTSGITYKGLHFLILSMRHVIRLYPNVTLRVAGISIKDRKYRNSAYVNYLLYLIKFYKLEQSIVFLGNLDEYELKAEMYGADVFICSSYSESYCLALAEALSIGVPSIAPYTSALPELISDGNDGYYYPINDEYVCADRILKLLTNKELRLQFSMQSSIKMRQKIMPTKIAEDQAKTYKTIVGDFNKK